MSTHVVRDGIIQCPVCKHDTFGFCRIYLDLDNDDDNNHPHGDDNHTDNEGRDNCTTEQSLKRQVQSLEELLDRQLNKDRAQAAELIQQQKREYEHRLRTLQCSMMRTERNMEQTTHRLREIEQATTLFQERAEFLEIHFEQEIKMLQGQVDFFNDIAKENKDLKKKLLQKEDELRNLRGGAVASIVTHRQHESILKLLAATTDKKSVTQCEETKVEEAHSSKSNDRDLLRHASLRRRGGGEDDESDTAESLYDLRSLRGLTTGSIEVSTDSVQDLLSALKRAQDASARAQGKLRNRDKTTLSHTSSSSPPPPPPPSSSSSSSSSRSQWNDQLRNTSFSSSSLEVENDMDSFHTWQSRLSNHRNRRRTDFMEEEIAKLEKRVQDMLRKIGRS
jgi:hypothetical protein